MHRLRPSLRAHLKALLETGACVEFDRGASGSHLCRIRGPGGEVTGAGGSVERRDAPPGYSSLLQM